MKNTKPEGQDLEENEMLPEYDFTDGVRGNIVRAFVKVISSRFTEPTVLSMSGISTLKMVP